MAGAQEDGGRPSGRSLLHDERVLAASVTALALLAVGVAAAALDAGNLDPRLETGLGATESFSADGGVGGVGCPAPLTEPLLFAGFLGVLVGGAVYASRRARSPTALAIAAAPVCVGWAVLCRPYPQFDVQLGGAVLGVPIPVTIEQFLLGLLGLDALLVLISLLWIWYHVGGVSRILATAGASERDGAELSRIGERAGDLADRLERRSHDERASDENLVYAAWREMTALVAVSNPETCTPGEFAEAAVAAGMAPEHVAELTRLFEDVRYGDEAVAERERRAIEVLRRIERAYGVAEDAERVDGATGDAERVDGATGDAERSPGRGGGDS